MLQTFSDYELDLTVRYRALLSADKLVEGLICPTIGDQHRALLEAECESRLRAVPNRGSAGLPIPRLAPRAWLYRLWATGAALTQGLAFFN